MTPLTGWVLLGPGTRRTWAWLPKRCSLPRHRNAGHGPAEKEPASVPGIVPSHHRLAVRSSAGWLQRCKPNSRLARELFFAFAPLLVYRAGPGEDSQASEMSHRG